MSQLFNNPFDDTLAPHDGEVEVAEEQEVIFSITGEDISGANRALGFQIRSLVQRGYLYDQSNTLLVIGQVINDGSGLKYVGEKDFFNEPYSVERQSADNHFFFSAIVPLEGGGYISSLKLARQIITVINVNDPPTLIIPYAVKSVSTFTSLSWESKECSNQGNAARCKSKLLVNNIAVDDVDGNLDYLRVDVKTSHGILTLNDDNVIKANFASCSNRSHLGIDEVTWGCKGTGFGDREMTFIARPLDLNDIFTNMTYESLVTGKDDIIVAIHDGAGGECLSSKEHDQRYRINNNMGRPTIHRQCTSVVRSQTVNVLKDETFANSQSRKFPLQLIIAILFATLVLLSLTVILPIIRWWKDRKGSQVAPHNKKGKGAETGTKKIKFISKMKLRDTGGMKKNGEGKKMVKKNKKDEAHPPSKKSSAQKKDKVVKKNKKDEANPPSKKSSAQIVENNYDSHLDSTVEWIQYFDESTGDQYYENTLTRRVTWTEPQQYINGEE